MGGAADVITPVAPPPPQPSPIKGEGEEEKGECRVVGERANLGSFFIILAVDAGAG